MHLARPCETGSSTSSTRSSSDAVEDVEPKTDAYLHDDRSSSSSKHCRKRGIKRCRFIPRPRVQKKRGSYWSAGTVASKNHVVRRSRTFGFSVSKAFNDAVAKFEEMSNESRNRQFHKLFSFIPSEETVIVSYSCALVKESMFLGRMFISQNWICFHSHIFKYETQVTIKMNSISSISKARTAFVIPNAIGIQTENEKYVFGSLLSRKSTYKQLIKVWRIALSSAELIEEEVSSCTSNDCSGMVPSELELVHSFEEETSEELEQRLQYDEEDSLNEDTTPDERENDSSSSHPCSHNATAPADSNPTFTTRSCQHMCKLLLAMSVFKSLERLLKLLKAMTPVQFFLLLTACLIICLTVSAVILTYRIARLQPQLDNKPQSLQYTQTLSEWSSLWWSQQATQSLLIAKMWETIANNLRTLAQVHQTLQVLHSSSPPSYNQESNSVGPQEGDDNT